MVFNYNTPEEKAAIVRAQEALGLTMLHDSHNIGPDGENEIQFEVAARPKISQPNYRQLYTDALTMGEKLDIIAQKLGLV